MDYSSINLDEKLGMFTERWSPKIIARMNDYHFKLVKLHGEFIWHSHADTDEVFLVLHGSMRIYFRDGWVEIESGEMFTVPRGVEHKTFAQDECHAMIVESAGTVNTGGEASARTAPNDAWL